MNDDIKLKLEVSDVVKIMNDHPIAKQFKEVIDAWYETWGQYSHHVREALLAAWMAETGILPSEAEIVEERDGNTVRMYVRKREV